MDERSKDLLIPRDSLGLYSKLLGLEQRRLPRLDELPATIDFPVELLGDVSPAIDLTRTDGKERKQLIYYNGRIIKGRLIKGTLDEVEDPRGLMGILFGEKPLVVWHIHPDNDSKLSPTDIRNLRMFPRMGYISAVFGLSTGTFIFQTEESAKLPIKSVITGDWNLQGVGYYAFDLTPDPNWGTGKELRIRTLHLERYDDL